MTWWRAAWHRFAEGDGRGPVLWVALALLGACMVALWWLAEKPIP